MKKTFILAMLALTLSLSACGLKINEEEAKKIALERADVAPEEAVFVRTELDEDDGKVVYETEFYTESGVEYDIDVNAKSGEVEKFEVSAHEVKDDKAPIVNNTDTVTVPEKTDTSVEKGIITKEEAKAIALEKAGVAEADVGFFKINLDYDDGIQVYDIEFNNGRTEYEFEIKADNGKILSYDYDDD